MNFRHGVPRLRGGVRNPLESSQKIDLAQASVYFRDGVPKLPVDVRYGFAFKPRPTAERRMCLVVFDFAERS